MVWLWLGCSQYGIVGKDEFPADVVPEDTTSTEDWRGGWPSPQLGECVWIYGKDLPEAESTCQEVTVNWQMVVEKEVNLNIDNSILGVFSGLYLIRDEESSFIRFLYQFSTEDRFLYKIYSHIADDDIVIDRFFDREYEPAPGAKIALIKMQNDIYY